MKNVLFLFLFAAVLLLISVSTALAQILGDTIVLPDPLGSTASLTDFLNLYTGLESAVIIILGYLHNWIPGLNMIPSKWIRIILIGAITAIIFAALGLNGGIGSALIFLQTVGFYELILKKVQPSPPLAK